MSHHIVINKLLKKKWVTPQNVGSHKRTWVETDKVTKRWGIGLKTTNNHIFS